MAVNHPPYIDLSMYIEARFFGERPHLRDRRVPVAMIGRWQRTNGWTVAELAQHFTLSETEVLAALLYYEQHQGELDAQEAEEDRLFDEMKRLHK